MKMKGMVGMKSINEDIKNQKFKNVYLLYGEEGYLKRLYKNKLKNAIVAENDTMNYAYYEGKDINPREIIDLAQTMPFFADIRLIVIENSGFFKNKCDELAEYINEISESTCIVFVESEVDKRGRMYKAVKEKGKAVEMNAQDEAGLTRWILGLLAKDNKKITQNAMQLFLSKTGADMENIQKELEKLICYIGDREAVTEEDVEEICSGVVTNNIFEMISAVSQRQQKKALDLYYDLLALKEPPMRILFLLSRQFNLLMQVKDLNRLGFNNADIAKKVGLSPYIVGKYLAQGRSFGIKWLYNALSECVQMEEDIKVGKMNDIMGVEMLIIKFSMEN